jgi:hypothetical protein
MAGGCSRVAPFSFAPARKWAFCAFCGKLAAAVGRCAAVDNPSGKECEDDGGKKAGMRGQNHQAETFSLSGMGLRL